MANSVFLWPGLFSVSGGVITFSQDGIATTSTNGLILSNATAATSGVTVQMSPRLLWRGNAWDTAASETVDFFAENLPATAATPTGTWKLGYSLNGAAASYPLTVTSAGGLTTGNFIVAGGSVFAATGSSFIFNSRSIMRSQSDGTWDLVNNGSTSGFGLDGNTDAVAKLRTRAQNAYATLDCLGLKASGAAGFNGTVTPVTTITVVNGIVTNVG
jgi:hypothetical protein